MPDTDINNAVTTDLTNNIEDYKVASSITDGASGVGETRWMNTNWMQWLGNYRIIPEYKTAIDAKATWTIGKGFIADEVTTMLLDTIKGNGKDTFNTILENGVRVYHIGGDSYAEIIRDKGGVLINLKPLDPQVMVHILDERGRIKRFDQISKIKGQKPKKFEPEEIFYLARNRLADEGHGNSVTEAVADIILMRNEAMKDWKRVLHRNVDPLWVIHADTDNATKIAKIKADWEEIKKQGETWVVPKGVVVPELIAVAPNATMNPLPWIEVLNNYFFQAVGVPQIIVGGTGAITEAAVKIAYLAFQQTIEEEQLFIEEQVLAQLNLVIELEFPVSLENEALSDKPKVEERPIETEQAAEPNDTTAEVEGRK